MKSLKTLNLDVGSLGDLTLEALNNMTKAADTACCNSQGCDPGCDTTLYYMYVWNAVMATRVARMINQTLYEPIAKHFPDVEMSNFDQSHYDSSPAYWAGSLNSYVMPPIGSGVHIVIVEGSAPPEVVGRGTLRSSVGSLAVS